MHVIVDRLTSHAFSIAYQQETCICQMRDKQASQRIFGRLLVKNCNSIFFRNSPPV